MDTDLRGRPRSTATRLERSSLRSHARAVVHVRCTDLDEIPSAWAVSCKVSPAKTRVPRRPDAAAIVEPGQPLEGDIDGEHFVGLDVAEERREVVRLEVRGTRLAATLLPRSRSRVIDEDAAHRQPGDRQQALPVHRLHLMLLQQAEIGLVHEGRRRERVIRCFAD